MFYRSKAMNTSSLIYIVLFAASVSTVVRAEAQAGIRTAGTPQQYGAMGDGKADDTKALQECFAEHSTVLLSGTYVVSDSIHIRSGQQVFFENASIRFMAKHGVLFYSFNSSDWQFSGKGRITGTGFEAGDAIAIYIEGGKNIDISGITVEQLHGTAVDMRPGKTFQRGNCVRLSNSAIINCWTGVKVAAGSEYHSIMNTNVIGCSSAAEIRGGNVSWTGGNIGDNTKGLFVGGRYGTNNAHGIFNGVNINHNTEYNIWCDSVELGQTFVGCHVYGEVDRSIVISESRAVSFTGGIIDGRIAISASSSNQFHYFTGVQLEPYFNLTPAFQRAYFVNCYTRDGGLYRGNTNKQK